jgi:hypothetical protein
MVVIPTAIKKKSFANQPYQPQSPDGERKTSKFLWVLSQEMWKISRDKQQVDQLSINVPMHKNQPHHARDIPELIGGKNRRKPGDLDGRHSHYPPVIKHGK